MVWCTESWNKRPDVLASNRIGAMQKLECRICHCYNIHRTEFLSEIIFPSEVRYCLFSSRIFPKGSNPLYFLWPISIKVHLANKPATCIFSCEWYSTTVLILPAFLNSRFCFLSFSLDNLHIPWTFKLNCVPLSFPLLKESTFAFTQCFRQNSSWVAEKCWEAAEDGTFAVCWNMHPYC